jgi:hypothetical protein
MRREASAHDRQLQCARRIVLPHWKFECRRVVDGAVPGLRELCKSLNETYRRALDTDRFGQLYLEGARVGAMDDFTDDIAEAINATA